MKPCKVIDVPSISSIIAVPVNMIETKIRRARFCVMVNWDITSRSIERARTKDAMLDWVKMLIDVLKFGEMSEFKTIEMSVPKSRSSVAIRNANKRFVNVKYVDVVRDSCEDVNVISWDMKTNMNVPKNRTGDKYK